MDSKLMDMIPSSLVSYKYFCKEVLGMVGNADLGMSDLNGEHEDLIKFLEGPGLSKMVLMPRYSLKSTLITVGWSCHQIVRDPNVRILIYSDTSSKAQGFMLGIKNHLQGNAPNTRFHDVFPGYDNEIRSGKWNDNEITTRKRTAEYIEPTVDCGGIETTKVGRHYDIIIFDDIVSDVNTTTKAQMDKVYDCYKKSLSLLKPGGKILIVGTRWAFGDAYGRIIADDKDFKTFIRKAEVDGKYPFESIGLTKEFLEKQKNSQGTYFYSCLYQNEPISDEEAIFKYDQFSFYERLNTEGLHITCTVDPAGDGDDYTAMTVVGVDKDNTVFILDVVNRKLKPNQITDKIIELSYKWRFRKLGIEINFFEHLEKEIRDAVEKEKSNIDFLPFSVETFRATSKAGNSKFHRILSLQPWHERGQLKFPGVTVEGLKDGFYELAMQMMQFTQNHRPLNDDALDALAYQVRMIRPGDVVATEVLPDNSFKRVYLEQHAKRLEFNRKLPYRLRKVIYEPLFG